MSSSTANNLSQHLSWLIRETPCVPPTRTAPPIDYTISSSSASTGSITAQATSFSAASDFAQSHARTAAAISQPVLDIVSILDQNKENWGSIRPPVDIIEKVKAEDMARLRAGPSSVTRPGLVSQNNATSKQTPCMPRTA
jgi:hypothetical protein